MADKTTICKKCELCIGGECSLERNKIFTIVYACVDFVEKIKKENNE